MASKPALRIPTFYRPASEIDDWLATSAPGDTTDYAVGPTLDQAQPVVRRVAQLAQDGKVVPCQSREEVGGKMQLVYRVQRAAPSLVGTVARRIRRDEEWEQTEEGRLFLLLARHANIGLPCPSYATLAERLDLRDRQAARYRMSKLQQMGRIRVTQGVKALIVTINDTGKRTPDLTPEGQP